MGERHGSNDTAQPPDASGASALECRLTELDGLPAGVLELPAERLHECLPGPTLVHLPGVRSPPLFVAVLLHADDTGGWDALRTLLSRRASPLPRALSVFIANVGASTLRPRRPPGWGDAGPHGDDATSPLARAVFDSMKRRSVHAAIDVSAHHGAGPPYAEIVDLRPEVLGLARGFGPLAVLRTILSRDPTSLFASIAPALRIDCGERVDPHGVERALHFLERRLTEATLPHALANALQLFVCTAHVEVVEAQAIAPPGTAGLQLRSDLEASNFRRLPAGTLLARQTAGPRGLVVHDTAGDDVTDAWLDYTHGEIRLRREVFPIEYTADPDVVRSRGLCTFVQPYVSRFHVPGKTPA